MAAGRLTNLSVEDIDLTLRDAKIRYAELNFLHHMLNDPATDDRKRKIIEKESAVLFKDMMSALYTVLDQSYYYLHCHFQNNGNTSFGNKAFQIKAPIKQKLKYSNDATRDNEVQRDRNQFVNDQCTAIFGDDHEIPRSFQEDILSLQAVIEVDNAGRIVETCSRHETCSPGSRCVDRGPQLVYARRIEHGNTDRLFNPANITFEKLKSVANRDDWNHTTAFNLLNFFRNFTTHRALISCPAIDGYLNLETRDFKAEGEEGAGNAWPWIKIAKGAWILVPEISHLRDKTRTEPPRFYTHPLLIVCSNMLSFVETQRSNLLRVADDQGIEPIDVAWSFDGQIVIKRGNEEIDRYVFIEKNGRWAVVPAAVLTVHDSLSSTARRDRSQADTNSIYILYSFVSVGSLFFAYLFAR